MVSVLILSHALIVLIEDDGVHRRAMKSAYQGTRLAGARGYWSFGRTHRWIQCDALDYDQEEGSTPIARGGPVPHPKRSIGGL